MRKLAQYFVTAYRSTEAPAGQYFAADRKPFASLDEALRFAESEFVADRTENRTGVAWSVETRNGRVYFMSAENSFPPVNAKHVWKDGVISVCIESASRALAQVAAERREGNDVPDLAQFAD